jgi:hypothetical protein
MDDYLPTPAIGQGARRGQVGGGEWRGGEEEIDYFLVELSMQAYNF